MSKGLGCREIGNQARPSRANRSVSRTQVSADFGGLVRVYGMFCTFSGPRPKTLFLGGSFGAGQMQIPSIFLEVYILLIYGVYGKEKLLPCLRFRFGLHHWEKFGDNFSRSAHPMAYVLRSTTMHEILGARTGARVLCFSWRRRQCFFVFRLRAPSAAVQVPGPTRYMNVGYEYTRRGCSCEARRRIRHRESTRWLEFSVLCK